MRRVRHWAVSCPQMISAPSRPDENPEHLHLFTEERLRGMLAACGVTQVKVAQVPGHWVAIAHLRG